MSAPTSRRAILSGSVAVVATGVVPAVAATHPDSALIAECAAFVAAEREYRVLLAAWGATRFGTAEESAADAALSAFGASHHARLDAIAATPARTSEGMKAKARAVLAFYEPDPPENDSVAAPALWSLVRDMAGAAS